MSYIIEKRPHIWGLMYSFFQKKKNHDIVSFVLKEKEEREVSESKRFDEM